MGEIVAALRGTARPASRAIRQGHLHAGMHADTNMDFS